MILHSVVQSCPKVILIYLFIYLWKNEQASKLSVFMTFASYYSFQSISSLLKLVLHGQTSIKRNWKTYKS